MNRLDYASLVLILLCITKNYWDNPISERTSHRVKSEYTQKLSLNTQLSHLHDSIHVQD